MCPFIFVCLVSDYCIKNSGLLLPLTFNPEDSNFRNALKRMIGGPQSRSGRFGEHKKITCRKSNYDRPACGIVSVSNTSSPWYPICLYYTPHSVNGVQSHRAGHPLGATKLGAPPFQFLPWGLLSTAAWPVNESRVVIERFLVGFR